MLSEPNNDEVICPQCCHQFRAIPVNLQQLMLDAGFEPPFMAAPVQAQSEPVAYWIPKAEQFCLASPTGRPFAKAWEPLFAAPVQVGINGLTEAETNASASVMGLTAPVQPETKQVLENFDELKAQNKALLEALKWALEWIDAVPKGTILPTMPGFDRDYVDTLISKAGKQ